MCYRPLLYTNSFDTITSNDPMPIMESKLNVFITRTYSLSFNVSKPETYSINETSEKHIIYTPQNIFYQRLYKLFIICTLVIPKDIFVLWCHFYFKFVRLNDVAIMWSGVDKTRKQPKNIPPNTIKQIKPNTQINKRINKQTPLVRCGNILEIYLKISPSLSSALKPLA